MSDPAIRYEAPGSVATITLDRPESRNRLDADGLGQLLEALDRAAVDPAVRVVVLTGTGSAFCSGADLAAAAEGEGFAASGLDLLVGVLTAILEHPKPVIARVQGHVAGGGNGLVAAADIAVAASEARFAFSEVRVGVAPAVISVVCLQVMHRRHAQELMLTGERVAAERALSAGLVTSVVAADDLDAAVSRYVEALLQGGPEAVDRTKELLRQVPAMGRDEAFAEMARLSAATFSSEEAREGMTAFLERRPPAWAPQA